MDFLAKLKFSKPADIISWRLNQKDIISTLLKIQFKVRHNSFFAKLFDSIF